jgi:uncharacterized protein YndB with AHSA1/START domain
MKGQWSIEIAAPPEKIWPFLAEPEKVLQWYFLLRKFEYTSEQRGVGAPLYCEERASGLTIKLNCVVTEWVEKERLAFRMNSGTMMKSYEERWTVEAIPSGSRFTLMYQGELRYGILGKLMGALGQSSSGAHVKEILSKLKGLAEA